MEKEKLIPIICAVCGILACIGMLCAAVLDDAFPKPLWALISIGYLISVAGNIYNYHNLRGKDKKK